MNYQLVTVPVTVSGTVSFPRMDPLVDRITQSKSFGRSETYANLLRYLVACSAAGNPPKEVTIAVEILGKTDFDSSESSTVRVYMYKLRKKLADYYAEEGKGEAIRLRIPKGSYAVVFEERASAAPSPPPAPAAAPTASRVTAWWWLGLLMVGLCAGYFLGRLLKEDGPAPTPPAIWAETLSRPIPKLLVLGDLLMFTDTTPGNPLTIRHPGINTAEEFVAYQAKQPEGASLELLTYALLVRNSTTWVKQLTELFLPYGQDFEIRGMSRLNPRELASNDLVVAGMLKTLGLFRDYFPDSPIQLISNDSLALSIPGQPTQYFSSLGNADHQHTDFGIIRKVPGPNDNDIFILGGLWDTGSSQMVKNVTDPELLEELTNTLSLRFGHVPNYFELLYRVEGIDRMELDTELLFAREISD
ncbi:MAG: hypothetical protein AAGA62_01670 [Bacteroidota bacterium]